MTLKTTAYGSMQPAEFRAYHKPALELQEVKHGLILSALGQLGGEKSVEVSYWTLGRPGECAIRMGHHSIVLGALDEKQCRNLADLTAHTDYPGVIGPDMTPKWFTDRARELGLQFLEPEPQQIYSISDKPLYPGASGHIRPVTIEDAPLLADWLIAFHREAVPHDPVPARVELEWAASENRFLFWIDNAQAVSMAGIARRLKTSAVIRAVYTRLNCEVADMPDRLLPQCRAHLHRGAQNCVPLCGPEKPSLESLLYEDRVQTGLQVVSLP
jgi:hypothetical protein